MALASNEFARRSAGGVEILPGAVRLSWPLGGMTTADAHSMTGRFTLSAQLADDPTDRKMFAEVMLGSKAVVTTADLVEQFSAAIQNAVVETAQKHSAEEWIAGDKRQVMIERAAQRRSAHRLRQWVGSPAAL